MPRAISEDSSEAWRKARELGFTFDQFTRMYPSDLRAVIKAREAALGRAIPGPSKPEVLAMIRPLISSAAGGRKDTVQIDGAKLKRLRRETGMTQSKLAETCSGTMGTDTIQRGERGDFLSQGSVELIAAGLTVALKRPIAPEDLEK